MSPYSSRVISPPGGGGGAGQPLRDAGHRPGLDLGELRGSGAGATSSTSRVRANPQTRLVEAVNSIAVHFRVVPRQYPSHGDFWSWQGLIRKRWGCDLKTRVVIHYESGLSLLQVGDKELGVDPSTAYVELMRWAKVAPGDAGIKKIDGPDTWCERAGSDCRLSGRTVSRATPTPDITAAMPAPGDVRAGTTDDRSPTSASLGRSGSNDYAALSSSSAVRVSGWASERDLQHTHMLLGALTDAEIPNFAVVRVGTETPP